MFRLVARILLSSLAFLFVLPNVSGIDFHGNFMAATILAIGFGITLWLVETVAFAIAAVWTVGTFGVALLWIIPLWIIGFWLLPACAFLLLSNMMPTYLTVANWTAAILGGLVMMAISLATSKVFWKDAKAA